MSRLSVEGPEIKIEGSIGDIVNDLARLTDAVLNAIEKNTNGDVGYHETMAYMLNQVAKLKKLSDTTSDGNAFGYEAELEFLQELRDLRKKHEGNPDWYEYESGIKSSTDFNKQAVSTTDITGGASLGKFKIDSQSNEEDILDIKRVIAEKAKAKKKK
jgi:hypothetical protein